MGGCGRRYANIVLKKADIPLHKRAGELSEEEVEKIITIMQNPRQYKIPDYFLNRQKDCKDGKTAQVMANFLDNKLREDWRGSRRSALTAACVTTGVSVCVASTPRPLDVADVPSVSPRRNKFVYNCTIWWI